MRTTPEMKTALKNEDHPKNEDDSKMKMTLKRKMKNFCGISYHILPRYLSICVIFIIYLLYTQQYTSPPPTLHFLFFIYIYLCIATNLHPPYISFIDTNPKPHHPPYTSPPNLLLITCNTAPLQPPYTSPPIVGLTIS